MSGVCCESKVKRHKSTCTWTIHDWESTKTWKCDMKFTSEIFSSVTNHETKWCLEIHPMAGTRERIPGALSYNQDYISVYLRLVSVKEGSVARAQFALYGLNEKNAKVTLATTDLHTFDMNTNSRIGIDRAFSKKYLVDASKHVLVLDDKLRLVCEVSEHDIVTNSGTPRIIVPKCHIVDDYSSLFKTKALSDVKIIAKGNVQFEAHKAILAVRSPVFAAMFKHKMREQSNNCVEITDTDPKVLEEMLRFIYTGKIGDIDEIVADLLVVADKYDLQRLKIMCEEKLFATLHIENAAIIFMMADDYNCKQLKTITSSFISQHSKDVIQTECYSFITESYPHIAEKLLRRMFL